MVSVLSLWLPILLSAVAVFVVSSVIHMMLGYHHNDFAKVPDEDATMDALRNLNLPPGDYVIPWAGSLAASKTPEFKEKAAKGPIAFLNVFPSGPPQMGQSLIQWFVYCIVVGIFAAYIAGRALGPGAPYLSVFRFAGCTAFAGYALALAQNSIWYKRGWPATGKSMFDGLVYALISAGLFGTLWPDA